MRKIITHPGQAHRDEFLACCVLIAEHGDVTIYRRDPTTEELNDPKIYVVDVGGEHIPGILNFDHHQLPREHEPTCALSMVLQHLGLYDDAAAILPWMKPTEVLDSKGPFAMAAQVGIKVDDLMGLMSPVESQILQMFQRYQSMDRSDHLYTVMEWIGTGIMEYIAKVSYRLHILETQHKAYWIGDVGVVDTRDYIKGNEDPALGLEMFCKVYLRNEPAVTVTNDDRGEGHTLFRRNDDPRIDFSRIKDSEHCVFAHANGFIAKVKRNAPVNQLIYKSIVRPVDEPIHELTEREAASLTL